MVFLHSAMLHVSSRTLVDKKMAWIQSCVHVIFPIDCFRGNGTSSAGAILLQKSQALKHFCQLMIAELMIPQTFTRRMIFCHPAFASIGDSELKLCSLSFSHVHTYWPTV
jgi:hypothetical protein